MQNPTARPGPIDILVVEDSPTQADRLRHLLEKAGYRVTLAANGGLALQSLTEHLPDLVVTDIVMPEMDGYELCRRIRLEGVTGDLPVILVTSLSDPGDVIRALDAGADGFIRKPYEDAYLLGRVGQAVANRELRRNARKAQGAHIDRDGRQLLIMADPQRALDLLLSTYEAAVEQNKELRRAADALRVLNESLSLRTDELEEVNANLEAFSFSVSHDLKAPLRLLNGFAEILEQDYASALDEEGRRVLSVIRKGAVDMGLLIDGLLSFSRMGRQALSFEAVDMQSLVQEAWAQAPPQLRRPHRVVLGRSPAKGNRRPGHLTPGGRQPTLECGQVHPPVPRSPNRGNRPRFGS